MKYIVTVRGTLKSTDEQEAQRAHNAAVEKFSALSKSLGNSGHRTYLNLQNRREFIAVDVWDNLEGLQKSFGDPEMGAEIGKLFEGQPDVAIWAETDWQVW